MKRTTTISVLSLLLCLLFAGNISAVNKTWLGTTASWNTASNWSPAGVPGTTDDVFFNNTGTGNCNIDANVIVSSITVASTYTGTISQNAFSVNISNVNNNNVGITMNGGTYNGGSGFINNLSNLNVYAGATFNTSSDTMILQGSQFVIEGLLNASSGKIVLYPTFSITFAMSLVSASAADTLNKLEFRAQAAGAALTYTISGNFTINDTLFISGFKNQNINGGNFYVKKHLYNTNRSNALTCAGGNTNIIFNGTGVQKLIAPVNQAATRLGPLPNIVINTSGTFQIIDTSNISGTWTYLSGTVSCPGLVAFVCTGDIIGTHTLSHVQFYGGTRTFSTAPLTNLYVDSVMIVGPSAPQWTNDTIFMIGSSNIVTLPGSGIGGGLRTLIDIKGTGTQKIIGNSGVTQNCLCNVQIDKAATDSLIITSNNALTTGSGFVNVYGNWRYVSGITGSGVGCVNFLGGNATGNPEIIRGSHKLPNVMFSAPNGGITHRKIIYKDAVSGLADTITVLGNTFTSGSGSMIIDSGWVNMNGNLGVLATGPLTAVPGTATFNFVGNRATQYFDVNGSAVGGTTTNPSTFAGKLPNVAISKTGGTLFMNDTVCIGGHWDYYSGTVDATSLTSVRVFQDIGKHINGTATSTTMTFDTVVLFDVNSRLVTGSFNVKNKLDLRAGSLTLNSNKIKVQNSSTTAVSYTTGFIVSETNPLAGYGILDWQVGTAPAGSVFVFPFAINGANYLPVTYTVTSPGNSATGSLALSTYPTNWVPAPNNLPYPTGITNLNNPLTGINNSSKAVDRYWVANTSNYGTVPTATFKVAYRDSEWKYRSNAIAEQQLQLSNWSAATSSWSLPNNTTILDTATNSASIANQNNYTAFVLIDTSRAHFQVASSDTTVCVGEYVTFTDLHAVAPPNSYSWGFPGGTPSSSTDSMPVIQYNTPGTYRVWVTGNYNGGTISDTFPAFITVVAGPTVVKDSTNPSCSGACTGKARLTISTPPTHTTTWYQLPNTTTIISSIDSINNKCVGSYVARVRVTGGCTFRDTFNLATPPALIATVTSSTNLSCNAVCNGAVTVTTSGGSGAITHTWTPGGVLTGTRTNLCAGIYIDNVRDAAGCTVTVRDTITQPNVLAVTIGSVVNNTCQGSCTGSAVATATGGTIGSGYNYTWSPAGGPGATATGLCAGRDTVRVTDANGCTATANVNITQPAGITASVTADSNVTCFGANNGSITITATGTGITHHWNPGGILSNVRTNLAPGVYIDTVTDVNGCFLVVRDTILEPSQLNASISSSTDVTCFGLCNGKAKVTASGGRPGYTYLWSTGATTDSIVNKCAGTYSVTVKDASLPSASACSVVVSVTITQPTALVATVSSAANITCFGACDGTASVTTSGGTTSSAYTHHWSPGGQTTATITGLCPGTYVDTVKDVNGCSDTARIVITQPTQVVANIASQTNVTCFGICNGKARATGTGGTGSYTHHWSTGSTTDSAINLCAGTYADTIRDANNCLAIVQVTITQPTQLALALASKTNLSCSGNCIGKLKVTPSGGTSPYTHHWSNGGILDSITGLCAGNYTDTVRDANGCSAIYKDSITAPPLLTVTATSTNARCFGSCDGTASATGAGGNAPYTHHWSNGATTAAITGLCAGTYTDTIKDAGNCTATTTVTITQPVALAATATQTNVTCFNACNGKAKVTPTAGTGTAPYTHRWDTGSLVDSAINLCAGTYHDTVIDANSCRTVVTVTITQPVSLGHTIRVVQNVTCNGLCDGKLVETITGGALPYSYAWSTTQVQTTDTARNLCPGTYRVTATDNNGCTVSDTAAITQPTVLTATITAHVNDSCFGQCNGRITVAPTGGTGTIYTHSWSNGATTAAITGLCAGNYADTVRDANGCSIIIRDTIIEPAVLNSSITAATNASCFGVCDGSATVTPTGGTANYAYQWSNNATTASINSLCADTYRVTITDAHGCNRIDSVVISQPALLVATTTGSTNVTCFGANNGTATVSVTGGTPGLPGYTHHWSNNQTTATATGLTAGTYVDTVRDANGCSDTAVVVITEPVQLTATKTHTSVSCFGQCDAISVVVPANGVAPYTHHWSNSQVRDTARNLCAGVYADTIRDANGCSVIIYDTITQPPFLGDSITHVNITCHGACNGTATVFPYGGNPGYTVVWGGGAVTNTITNLCPGQYSVTITDSRNCTRVDTVTITEPPVLAISGMTGVNTTCFGVCNGSAWGTVTGGTRPYTYTWTNGIGTTDTIRNLCAGTYKLTVTDAHGCADTDSIVITQPIQITDTIDSIVNISCHGLCDGRAVIRVSGGTAPYVYAWSNGQSTLNPSGLCAGTYRVTITDLRGCSVVDSITITEPPTLTATICFHKNVSCFSLCDGISGVCANGGVAPYSYRWSIVPVQTLDTIRSLCAGVYQVTITDAHGCTVVLNDTITQPPVLTLSRNNTTNVSCNGVCDGGVRAIPIGGTSPYTHHWSNGASTDTISAVCAGTYFDTIRDAGGCSIIDSVEITQPTVLTVSITNVANTSCYNVCNGRATATPSGGTAPYRFAWGNGATTDTITSLCAGTYHVTVTDAHNCTVIDTVAITQPTQLTATITSSTNLLCNSVCNGRAVVTAAGGTPFTVGQTYRYTWSTTPIQQHGDTAINLCAGLDSVVVTDANGCSVLNTVTITEPTVLKDTFTLKTNISCFGVCDGKVRVSPSGGTPPYAFSWSTGGTNDSITGLCVGIYRVSITDANGCVKVDSAAITQPTQLTADINSSTNASCNAVCDGKAKVTAVGGTAPYTYLWSNAAATTTDSVGALCAGPYVVTVTDAHLCTALDTIIITEPSILRDSIIAHSNLLCYGTCIGTATDSAWGGTAPYLYLWSTTPAQTGRTATGLCAGTYRVSVTDAHGCIAVDSVTITEPALLISRIDSLSNDSCFGQCNGFARTLTTGGTTPYTYLWNTPNAQTTLSVNNLCAGTFIVTVKDANQCSVNDTVTITQPLVITLTTRQTNVSCFGANDGKAGVHATGGNGNYTYTWSAGTPVGGINDSVSGLQPGVATVTVHDINGCSATATITITEPTILNVTASGSNVKCFGSNSGKVWATVTGGTPQTNGTYSYAWSGGVQIGNGDTIINLIAGTYCVTVTDAHGCTDTSCFTITQPLAPVDDTIHVSNVRCNGGNDGGARAFVTGGTPGYTYSWSSGFPVGGGDSVGGLTAGAYRVTITDANGCSLVDNFTITEPTALVLAIRVDSNTNCTASTGGLTVSLTGGTKPYNYVWNNGAGSTQASQLTSNSVTGLGVNSYTVVVTDSQGCSKQISASIVTKPKPVIDSATSTPTTCNTINGEINVYAHTGNAPLTYTWLPNVSTGSAASGLAAGTYAITVTDASGCDTTFSVVVSTINQVSLDSSHVKDAYCGHEDGSVVLFVSQGTLPYTFTWSHDTTANTNTVTNLIPGAYDVTITDANSCTVTHSYTIVDIAKPVISILPDTATKIHKGQSVDIAVTLVSSPDSVSYVWTPTTSLSCDSCATPTANPEETVTYLVRVTDTITGCYDSAYVTVVVKDKENIFIPNAITPNGDGVNDFWMIRELYYFPDNEVIVLNRWGDEVFRARPYNNDWGGTYGGKQLPAGTYYYIIKLNDTSESITGPITIIR